MSTRAVAVIRPVPISSQDRAFLPILSGEAGCTLMGSKSVVGCPQLPQLLVTAIVL